MSYFPDIPSTPGKRISQASTNAINIKNSGGTLVYLCASNTNAAPRYVKWYDKASAPTVGTDAPIHSFLIPGNSSGAGSNIAPPGGINFTTGISYAMTAGAADTDTTPVAAAEVIINYGWQ